MSAKVVMTVLLQVSSSLLLAAPFIGCGGGTARPAGPGFEAVAPILSQHCIACHQDNGIAPFPLTSYADAKAKAAAIKPAVSSREMPPSNADNSGSCGSFNNARWLTAAEIRDAVRMGRRRRATRHRPRHAGGCAAGAPGRR